MALSPHIQKQSPDPIHLYFHVPLPVTGGLFSPVLPGAGRAPEQHRRRMLGGPSAQCPLVSLALPLTAGAPAALPRKRRPGAAARTARSRLSVEVAAAPAPARPGAPEPRSLGSHPGSPAARKARCGGATWKTGNRPGPRPAGRPRERAGWARGAGPRDRKPAGAWGGRRVPAALCSPSSSGLQRVPGRESLPADPSSWAWPGPAEVQSPGGRWCPGHGSPLPPLHGGHGRGLTPGLHCPRTESGSREGRASGRVGKVGPPGVCI